MFSMIIANDHVDQLHFGYLYDSFPFSPRDGLLCGKEATNQEEENCGQTGLQESKNKVRK